MQVTSVSVRKIEKEGSRMKGIASIVLDDSFAESEMALTTPKRSSLATQT